MSLEIFLNVDDDIVLIGTHGGYYVNISRSLDNEQIIIQYEKVLAYPDFMCRRLLRMQVVRDKGLGVSQHNDDCSNPVVKVDSNKYNSFHISLLGRG